MKQNPLQQAFAFILKREAIPTELMQAVMHDMMQGEAQPAVIGAFLMGMALKGETVAEIVACVKVIQQFSKAVTVQTQNAVDIVGTGGDGAKTFNISTASAFVAAAAGAHVAKHQGRAISSHSGSADVLDQAGIKPITDVNRIAQAIDEIGIGFMLAAWHHAAFVHVESARKALGIRSLFNILGPLCNPANVRRQVIGVYDQRWLRPICEALRQLGSHQILMLHADDGLDEISIASKTSVCELKNQKITEYKIAPEDFGLKKQNLGSIQVQHPAESLQIMEAVFANQPGAARDIVALNAGAAIYCAGLSETLSSGVKLALKALANGSAQAKFHQYKTFIQASTNDNT